ncbi:MAG: hypothetical protein KDL87_13625, partial [Verrucomicrobiae bacterium]|nr:hypothetical protein [Verrucomicrobiae bacterium]
LARRSAPASTIPTTSGSGMLRAGGAFKAASESRADSGGIVSGPEYLGPGNSESPKPGLGAIGPVGIGSDCPPGIA